MKRFCIYIISVLSGLALAAGCADRNEYTPDNVLDGYISPYCYIESNSAGTKALIDQTTNTDSLFCNFLRIDIDIDNTSKSNPWNNVDWTDSYVSEGSISTTAPGTSISTTAPETPSYLRTISLHPPQPYHSGDGIVSRMVGWYPRNIDLPEDANDNDISTKAENFSSTIVQGQDYTGVRFTGLNGSTDIMVSNVLDGSVTEPFDSDKFFKFKHYLSAVKIYAKAENSSQDIGIWGEISNVIIMGQPTSCDISLPETAGIDSFGEVKKWGTENAKLPITTTPIFGPNDSGNQNIEAEEYPISLDSGNTEKYLGYSLIKPLVKDSDEVLRIQIHTSAVVYEVNVNENFEAGYLYELHLDFKTDNTIQSYLSIVGNEKYFDLTTLEGYQPDPESSITYNYKYANCYMVFSDPSGTEQDPDGNEGSDTYDGFCFDATVVGNGEKGIISEGAQHMYPRSSIIKPFSADILWETSPRLITQVELIYGYIRFKVARNNDGSFKEGNAVLVAYDEYKNILWSWHIWITDKPEEITYTEESTSITILDRNIGATAAHWDGTDAVSGTPLETYGLYYQWGRKDPSMGPPEWDYSPINMTTAPYYDYSSEIYHTANVMRFESPTLKDAVENPMYLIMPTSQTQTYYFNWLGEKIDFLWGYDSEKGTTQKTIYDPCPYGYRVSGGELADLFSYATTQNDINITRDDYGQIVNISKDQFYFPYTGFKGVDRGLNSLVSSWRYVGQKGDYQSSIVSTYATDEEYFMHRSRVYISKERTWNELNVGDYTGYQIEDHTNRRTAAPVRCVKNEEHNRVMAFITPDKQYVANNSDKVTFTLYAHSFQTNISTATLSVGYHLKSNEEKHIDKVIGEWTPGTKEWNNNNEPFTFDFSNLKDSKGNAIDVNTTTGQFRFILHVKSEDNINKTSSTTVKLLENDLIFQRWNTMDSTVFAGDNIDRQVRIIGVTTPTKVEMIINGNESSPIDITSGLSPNSSPEYPVDYLCSTNGKLSFSDSDKGWNHVYFKVTYESGNSGNVVTYKTPDRYKKWFKVVSLTQTTAITDGSDYVIRNYNTNGYLYDNGNRIAPSSTISYNPLFFFNFENTGSGYKIKNKSTKDYVIRNNNTLNISDKDTDNATQFSLTENGDLFRIEYEEPSYWGSITYWWVLQNKNSTEVSSRNQTNRRDWIIYLVDDSGIPANPS